MLRKITISRVACTDNKPISMQKKQQLPNYCCISRQHKIELDGRTQFVPLCKCLSHNLLNHRTVYLLLPCIPTLLLIFCNKIIRHNLSPSTIRKWPQIILPLLLINFSAKYFSQHIYLMKVSNIAINYSLSENREQSRWCIDTFIIFPVALCKIYICRSVISYSNLIWREKPCINYFKDQLVEGCFLFKLFLKNYLIWKWIR